MQIIIDLDDRTAALLGVLAGDDLHPSIEHVINRLIDHAQQGVYRPGAWERGWLEQVFGDDPDGWQARLERDPKAPMFDRPIGKDLER